MVKIGVGSLSYIVERIVELREGKGKEGGNKARRGVCGVCPGTANFSFCS